MPSKQGRGIGEDCRIVFNDSVFDGILMRVALTFRLGPGLEDLARTT